MSAVPWRVRAATVADAPAVAAARYRDHPEAANAVAHYAHWLAPKIARDEYLGFLAFVDDALVAGAGAVLLDWGPRLDSGPVHTLARVNNIFTVEGWRRRGLARLLATHVLEACRARRLVYVMLAGSDMGQPLYQSLGFEFKRNEMVLRLTDGYAPAAPRTNSGSS
jgi:GNAT superfamily N-acetyltransferase